MAKAEKYKSKYFTNAEIDELLNSQDKGAVCFAQDTEGNDSIIRVFSVGPEENKEYRKNKWFEVRDSEDGFTDETEYINKWCIGKWRVGKPYSMALTFTSKESNKIRLTDKNNYIQFTFATTAEGGSSISEAVKVHYAFNNAGSIQTKDSVYNAGETAKLKVDDFLSAGTNTVTITVTGLVTGTEVIRSVVYEVTDMVLTTTFNVAVPVDKSKALKVPYSLVCSASGLKTIEFRIDGTAVAYETTTENEISGNKEITITSLTAGEHFLEIFAYIAGDDGNFYSNTLFREFCVEGAEGKWIMAAFDLEPGTFINSTKQNLVIKAEQYVDQQIQYGFYSSDGRSATVRWTLGGANLHAEEADVTTAEANGDPYTLTFQPQYSGEMELKAQVGATTNAYKLLVNVNASGVQKTTTNLSLELSAKGRTNGEPVDERCVWKYGNIAAQFPNGWAWSKRQGWDDELQAMVISGGKQITIPIAPFANAPHIYGATVEFDYEVTDVDDENETVISIMGKSQGGVDCGLQVKAESITAQSTNEKMYATFPSSQRQHLCFSVFATDDAKFPNLAFLYLEGTYKACLPYADARWTNSAQIKLGSANDKALLRIYNVRVYAQALNVTQYLWNQAIDAGTISATIARNDIYEGTSISVNKMQSMLPIGLIDGKDRTYNNIKTLEASDSKSVKVKCDYQYINPNNRERNFTVTDMIWWLQGTSSLRYPRKNFKGRTYKKNSGIVCKDWQGKVINKGLIQVVEGDMPCNELTFKADFMDSSCTRNATLARIFGDIEPLVDIKDTSGNKVMLTPPQVAADKYKSITGHDFPYKIRTTPNAEAMMLFHRLPGDTQYTCLGQYTMLNDKGNEELYGFKSVYAPTPGHYDDADLQWIYSDPCCQTVTDTYRKELLNAGRIVRLYDNKDTHCYEILDNSSLFANFSTLTGWDTPTLVDAKDKFKHLGIESAFESRYPEIDDDDYDTQDERNTDAKKEFLPLKAFIWWMTNTTDFDGEVSNHIRMHNCGGYKVSYDRFGMVDQIKKNMMWTTYGDRSTAVAPANMPEELKPYFNLLWMPIRYDNDSTVDKRNTGSVFFNYEFDRDSLDTSSDGGYCYSGHDSQLWNKLEASTTFMDIYREVDEAFYEAGLTLSNVISYYVNTMSQWPEQAYNENMLYKYIAMVLNASGDEQKGWISFLQGMDKAHIIWWLTNRFAKIDADNGTGDFANKNFSFIAANTPQNSKMYFTSGKTTKYGWRINKKTYAVDGAGNMTMSVNRGADFQMLITKDGGLSIGDPVYVNNASNLTKIDLHELATYLSSTFELSNLVVENVDPQLKTLIIGVSDTDYAANKRNNSTDFSFSGITKCTRLEYLDVKGFTNMTNCDYLTSLPNIKTFLAKGTSIKSFKCADGCKFTKLQLSDATQGISVSRVNWQTLDYTPNKKLTTLNLGYMNDETDYPNVKQFVFDWLDMLETEYGMSSKWTDYDLTLTGVDWTEVSYHRLEQLMNLGRCYITGHSYIKCQTEFTSAQMTTLLSAFGNNIFTTGSDLVIDCNSTNLVLGIEALDGTVLTTEADGVIMMHETGKAKVRATGFGNLRTGQVSNVTFGISNASTYGVSINAQTGVISSTEEGYDSHDLTFYAYNSVATGTLTLRIRPLTYPTSVAITEVLDPAGNTMDIDDNTVNITAGGIYTFRRALSPSGTTGSTKQHAWTYSGTNTAQSAIHEQTETELKLNIKTITGEINETLKYWVAFKNTAKDPNTTGITSPTLTLAMFADTVILLRNAFLGGNVKLYDALLPKISAQATQGSITALELRSIIGALSISSTSEVATFTSVVNGQTYNVLDYLRNVTSLSLAGVITLTGDIDITKMNNLTSLDLSGTSARNVTGVNGKASLTSIHYAKPTAISITNCPNLNITANDND